MAADEVEPATFESLPQPLALCIFTLLPADARARCTAVRRAWHRTLEDQSAWTRLDLSSESGVTCGAGAEAMLLGAAAKARGALAFLDVRGRDALRAETLLRVVAESAGALTQLRATVRRASLRVAGAR